MTDAKSISYQHDGEGRILLIEDGRSCSVMNGRTFPGVLACAAVHELNNALLYGGINGGTSTFRTDGCYIYVRHAARDIERIVPVFGLDPEQTQALTHELHQAGQMGPYT